jgi:hypothetical protein
MSLVPPGLDQVLHLGAARRRILPPSVRDHRESGRTKTGASVLDEDPDRAVAQWMVEVAHRKEPSRAAQATIAESSGSVLEYLEARTGRSLRSRKEVDNYLQDLAAQKSTADLRGTRRGIRRGALLLSLALVAYLDFYYYWDVNLQIASIPKVHVFLPAGERDALR